MSRVPAGMSRPTAKTSTRGMIGSGGGATAGSSVPASSSSLGLKYSHMLTDRAMAAGIIPSKNQGSISAHTRSLRQTGRARTARSTIAGGAMATAKGRLARSRRVGERQQGKQGEAEAEQPQTNQEERQLMRPDP